MLLENASLRNKYIFLIGSACFLTGPVLSKFINALRELATYKEFLRSQVSMLCFFFGQM